MACLIAMTTQHMVTSDPSLCRKRTLLVFVHILQQLVTIGIIRILFSFTSPCIYLNNVLVSSTLWKQNYINYYIICIAMQNRESSLKIKKYQIWIYKSKANIMHSTFQQSYILRSEGWKTDIPHLLSILL